MRWTGDVARTVEMRMNTKFYLKNLKGRGDLKEQDIDGRIILKWVSGVMRYEGVGWIHLA
jgi:hypothetical protein